MTTQNPHPHPVKDVMVANATKDILAFARSIGEKHEAIKRFSNEVIPLPRRLLDYWAIHWSNLTHPCSLYLDLTPLSPAPGNDATEFYREQLGMIAKTEAQMQAHGLYTTSKSVRAEDSELEDTSNAERTARVALTCCVEEDGIRDYTAPSYTVVFGHVDPEVEPTADCKIMYDKVELPARTIYRPRIVCEEPKIEEAPDVANLDLLPAENGTTVDAGAQVEAST